MIDDPFRNTADSPMAPAEDCFAILPSDNGDLARSPKAIFVGEGGDIVLRPLKGETDVTFRNLASGSVLEVRVRAIRATGTTAASIIGLA
ncbi:MAG: hypothetical protein JY451_07690 [Erythrobacter sp.]|nr:MAG: hypothetical protein JY451_07690 [Erythrobacter sp.]